MRNGLPWMQDKVGGYIERVIHDADDVLWAGCGLSIPIIASLGRVRDVWVNEEGYIHRLPHNQRASSLINTSLVGDVLLEMVPEGDEEE